MIDLVCLRSFAHVCEIGTVAGAATQLGYTAPAVSQQLAKLARDVGSVLFDRAGGRLRPTEQGTVLLGLAAEMLDLEERCRHLDSGARRVEPLTIAAFASAIAELVAPALAELPGRSVVVHGVDDDAALRALRLGHADIAVVQEYDTQPLIRDRRFVYSMVARDALRLVAPPSFSSGTTLADLADHPWLLNGAGTHCSSAVLHILDAAGLRPTIAASVDDNRALLRLVAAGHGAGIVPALVLAGGDDAVTTCHQPLGATRTILAVTRRSSDDRGDGIIAALSSAATRDVRR